MNLLKKACVELLLNGAVFIYGISPIMGQSISPDLYTDSTMAAGDNRNFNLFDVGPNQDIYMKVYGYDFTNVIYFYVTFNVDTSRIKWMPIGANRGFLTSYGNENNILNNNYSGSFVKNVQEAGKDTSLSNRSSFTIECLIYKFNIPENQAADGNGLMVILHFRTSNSFSKTDTASITITKAMIGGYQNTEADTKTISRYLYATINYFSPLPVTFQSFDAREQENGSISIEWETIASSNILGYSVERSYEDGEYREIAFISSPTWKEGEMEHFECTDTEAFESGTYYYRLRVVEINGSIQYGDPIHVEIKLPEKFSLFQNYPNPFNGDTRIAFSLPEEMAVNLKIYDVCGRLVATVISGKLNAGNHIVHVSSEGLSSGIYFYRLAGGTFNKIMKMSVIK